MENVDWGMIGSIATIVGVIIAIIQGMKSKKKQECSKQNNQNIKGLFISKNEINQNNK